MLLKLRQDYKQQQGKAYSLKTFHDTLLGNAKQSLEKGTLTAHRRRRCGPSGEGV